MPSPRLVGLDYAAELVEPGSTVTISGMTFIRNPVALVAGLVRRGVRDLCVVDREPGFALDVMAAAGLLRCVRDPWTGEELVAVRAIEPDYALIHVHVSDPYGNAVIEGPRFEDELKIRAARRVIISAERIVDTEELRGC